MRASILSLASFRLRRESAATVQSRNWSQQELAELYRVRDRLVQSGLRVALDLGLTDENEPWAVFVQSDSGEAFVHIARLNGSIVVANMMANVVYRGEDFRSITDQMLQDAPLVLPARKSSDSKVVMHPRSVFTAFVAAAVVLSEFVRSIEPAKAASEQEKVAQDKVVAETKALFPLIFDRVLARDAGWSAPVVTHGAAASLMAAAVGAVLIVDDHKDDVQNAASAAKDWLVVEAAMASSVDSVASRTDHASADDLAREEQTLSTPQAVETKVASVATGAAPAEERSAAIDTPASPDAKLLNEPYARVPDAPTETASILPTVKIAAAAPPEHAPSEPAPTAQSVQAVSNSEAKGGKEVSLVLDSILSVRLPDGANERTLTQAIDKALESAPHGEERPSTLVLVKENSNEQQGDAAARNWILHTFASDSGPALMKDGSHDVILLAGQDITVYNFRFNEDYLLFNGELDSTSWIKSIEVHGDDVVIVATNGSVISLIDSHGLVA